MCDYYSKHNFIYEKKIGNPPHPNISVWYSLHSIETAYKRLVIISFISMILMKCYCKKRLDAGHP